MIKKLKVFKVLPSELVKDGAAVDGTDVEAYESLRSNRQATELVARLAVYGVKAEVVTTTVQVTI